VQNRAGGSICRNGPVHVTHVSVYGSDTATYTTKEAAERLGLEVSHVRRLLEEGKIEGKEFGRDWMILGLDCERRRAPKREKGESNEKSQVFR
jgi:excisionase family DNA binding protein